MTSKTTLHKFVRFCVLFLPLLLSLSGFRNAFAQTITLSTRVRLPAGGDATAGFIITNPSGANPKKVLIRGISLGLTVPPPPIPPFTLPQVLADPVLQLLGPGSFVPVLNDNWMDPPNDVAAINATTVPPRMDPESAILMDLDPGMYTAILTGNTAADSGFALVEIYDLDHPVGKLANISTRAFVGTNDDIVIAGFTLDAAGGSERIIVRGLGPSLAALGVPAVLANPTLELRDAFGTPFPVNDDWQDDPDQAAFITAVGLAPTNPFESAIYAVRPPGDYTVLLKGLNNSTGNGLIEIYDLGPE